MKKRLFVLLGVFTLFLQQPLYANDIDVADVDLRERIADPSNEELDKDSKERKVQKKKKGERNVKIQPSKEDDENIILELD